jgi:DMSO/TMAO reductase YedYZ molybdopterin-dependent catalytic subunit
MRSSFDCALIFLPQAWAGCFEGEDFDLHRFPLRLMVPGFEGIYQIKYLRRIKVVDRQSRHAYRKGGDAQPK